MDKILEALHSSSLQRDHLNHIVERKAQLVRALTASKEFVSGATVDQVPELLVALVVGHLRDAGFTVDVDYANTLAELFIAVSSDAENMRVIDRGEA